MTTIFFSFPFFGGTRQRAAALLRFVCIFKEQMILRNSFGKPVKCIATTSCSYTEKCKYPDKILKQTLSFWQMSSEFVTAETNSKEKEISWSQDALR